MTQEETKARVDALIANAKEYIQKMYYAAIEEEELEIEHQDFVHICILSTQNTIGVLSKVKDGMIDDWCLINAIAEQEQILNELKSRIKK